MIDVNVNLSRWPFRRLAGDEPAALVAKLRKHGVAEAWAGSFDGIFHKDLAAANARLAHDCREYGRGLLRPFGSVNPMLPEWREDFRRCVEEHRMPGIRLHPNYHGYQLHHPALRDLLRLAAGKGLIVQLALTMEDERMQHPLMRVPPVDTAPLADSLASAPGLKLVLLNLYPQLQLEKIRSLPAHVDLSMTERAGAVARLIEYVTLPRVVFGSHYPLFYYESALLKLQESALNDSQKTAVLEDNARRLLRR